MTLLELVGDKSVGRVQDAIVGKDEAVKRVFDIVAATMGLILFAPILLITFIAVKLSRGPIFIRKTLYRYDNRAIQVLKFWATCVEGDQISPLGQILSQSGIDELPQLFNVVRGEMSIFGRRNVHRWPASRQDGREDRPERHSSA